MLQIRDLTKYYGSHKALDRITLTVEKNEILGLLGPNGAGKTTLMNIVAGYVSPTAGTVKVGGFDLLDEPLKCRAKIGYLPETPPLYDEMTVLEYLLFVADLKKLPKDVRSDRVAEIMRGLDLTGVSKRLIANLSRGYRQRLGVAQALVGEPELLILDEPTLGMDPIQIRELHEIIRGLKKRHTIIFSSHILSEVESICDRVAIIADGRLKSVVSDGGSSEQLDGMTVSFPTRYLIVTDGPEKEVRRTLRRLSGVRDVISRSGEDGAFESVTDGSQDIRRRVFFAMSSNSWPLLEFRPAISALEDRFMAILSATEKTGEK